MRNLKLKCPSCNRLFRTKNGLAWHQLHRHEIRLTYAELKEEIDKQLLSQVPDAVRQYHHSLMRQLNDAIKACIEYWRSGTRLPADIERERAILEKELSDLEVEYPQLGNSFKKS